MRDKIRIPVFENEFLFNVRNELDIKSDEPDIRWIDQNWEPEIKSQFVGGQFDSIAENEIFRLLKFKTCPYCRGLMNSLTPFGAKVLVCRNCFYWGGRGTRPGGPDNTRANLGRVNFVDNPSEVKLE